MLKLSNVALLFGLAVALPALSACGFKPVYGTAGTAAGTASAGELASVAVEPIPERSGQILRNLLIDRLYGKGRPVDPTWRLRVGLATAAEDLGIRRDATATRARLRLTANYELVDARSNQVVYRSFSRAIVSYNILEAQYGTLVAEQDAFERGLNELAEDIRTRLALYFAREPG